MLQQIYQYSSAYRLLLFFTMWSNLSLWAQDSAILKFADPLTDNMVVQQNKPFTVWGEAEPNAKVFINADWTRGVQVEANEKGEFRGMLPVPKIKSGDFTKHSITITSGKHSANIENVLIGEMWICSGQSNMQFAMEEVVNAKEELQKSDYPHIRLFNTALNFSNEPLMNLTGSWVQSTPETAKKFSAVGFYFAQKLYEKLNIPVGVVFTGIGASAAQAYVPREVLASDKLLDSVYLQPYLNSDRSKEKIDGGFSFEKVTRPYLLYNAIIHPLKNLSIRGICWYQGEANRNEREEYTRLMYKMIASWRETFRQDNLPFYYVQVAPYYYEIEDPTMADYAFFREAQEDISKMNNVEMVLTMDVGEARDLHPKNKKPIGERLARTALNRTYNFLDIAYRGPEFQSVTFKKKIAEVSFKPETIAGGLKTNDQAEPKFFQMAGDDKIFYPATATIDGNTIVLSSSKVKKPVAVRYAFTNYPVTNLQNAEGLPAVPFRSDDWKEPSWLAYKENN